MNWKLKAVFQKIASNMPWGTDLYFLGQKKLGGYKNFKIDNRLQFAFELIDCLISQDKNLEGKRAIEIGSGWAPILPLFFWLYGLSECHTFDILRLLKPSFVQQSAADIVKCCLENQKLIDQWKNRNITIENRRLPELIKLVRNNASPESILHECGIIYHAPADVSKTEFADSSIDIVFSNLVLGEIPIIGLDAIFSEAYRIIRPGGLMLHLIDLGDQFSQGNPRITPINFLQFSKKEFSKYNSPLNYQNRLRAPDYRQLFMKHGFNILAWRVRINRDVLSKIEKHKIHPDYSSYSPEDLCTTSIYVLAERENFEN